MAAIIKHGRFISFSGTQGNAGGLFDNAGARAVEYRYDACYTVSR